MSTRTERKIKVLVVENETEPAGLRAGLEKFGYAILAAHTAEAAVEAARRWQPDAILLDREVGGLTVLQRVREWSRIPVFVLSSRNEESEKVEAFDHGASDFLARPFSLPELLARLRAAVRLSATETTPAVFRTGSLSVDLASRTVRVGRRMVRLTVTEYSLLRLFVRHAGKVLPHAQILREVWGPKMTDKLGYLRVYLTYLRKKLETDPARPELLLTEPWVGYRLAVQEQRAGY